MPVPRLATGCASAVHRHEGLHPLGFLPRGRPGEGEDQGDGLLTPPRALLDTLMEAFFDVPPRITSRGPRPGSRPVKPAAQLERHEPAPKLEAVVVPVSADQQASPE
jgi:hypothetical protein